MNAKKQRRIVFYLFLLSVLSILIGCSNYKSFDEGELGVEVKNNCIRSWDLPYKSGEKIDIELLNNNGLLVTESNEGYHITKLNKDSGSSPQKYLKLECGDYYDWYKNNQLLVFGDKKNNKYIHLVDFENLTLVYTQEIDTKKYGDINIPGQYVIHDKILFFSSDFQIERYSYSHTVGDTTYTYRIPYLKSFRYNFNLLNIDNGRLKTYAGISEKSLGDLNGICEETFSKAISSALSKADPLAELENLDEILATYKEIAKNINIDELLKNIEDKKAKDREYDVQNYLYYIEKCFIVNNNKILVFSLKNNLDWIKNYAMDLNAGVSSIQQYTARELAEMFPNELVLKYVTPKKKTEKDKDIVISGKSYKLDDMAIFTDGIVLAVRESDKKAKYSQVLSVDQQMEKIWSYQVETPYIIGNLIPDNLHNIVYFPGLSHEKKYILLGLNIKNGEIHSTLPANFFIQKIEGKSYISVTGTKLDFENEMIYIHDKKNNRIICSNFPQTKAPHLE